MQQSGDTHSAAFVAAYPMVRRLALAGEPSTAEALLDRRAPAIAALGDVHRRTAALAMQDLGRAIVARARRERGAVAVHATSAIRLRSVLGPTVEADRWLLDVACLATLGDALDEVATLRDRLAPRLDDWRRLLLDLLADGDEDVARDGLRNGPGADGPPLLLRTARLVSRLPSDLTTTPLSA